MMDEEPNNSPATPPSNIAGDTVNTAERISDDQELFLKVLENLKNAVNLKPDRHSVALPKQQKVVQHQLVTQNEDLNPDRIKISSVESLARSDLNEPATSSQTSSGRTKSVVLQNTATSKEHGEISTEVTESFSKTVNLSTCIDADSQNLLSESEGRPSQNSQDIMGKATIALVEIETSSKEVIDKDREELESKLAEYIYKTPEKVKVMTPSSVRPVAPAPALQLYTCSQCDYYSENKNYLKQHMDLVHNNDRPFKCPFCEYAGKRSHALREHLIVHSNERPYQCQSCNATFRKKGHLTNHVKLHNSKRLVKCPLCKMLIYDVGENGLDAHLKNEHDTERLYGCDLCDYVAANEPEILTHLRSKHKSKVVAFKCDRCPFQTSNTSDFNTHMAAHKMVNLKVKIGENKPCEVVAVAGLPASETVPEIPNTAVKFEGKDKMSSQAAVIKPVWIKCSECGFTAQDSEVIKKHMLEHLGMEVREDTKQHVQQILAPLNTSLKQNSQQMTSVSVTTPSVLIPVTNVNNLFSQHTGKLNLNSPILVPVSDPAMLKSLQTVPVPGLQQSMQSKLIQIDPSVVTTATVASNMIQQTARSVGSKTFTTVGLKNTSAFNQQLHTGVVLSTTAKDTCLNVTPALTVPSSLTTMTPKQPVMPMQRHQIEQLLKNPNLKVIPVTGPQSSFSVTPPSSVTKSSTVPIVHVPGSTSVPVVHASGSKEAKAHLSEGLGSQTVSSDRSTSGSFSSQPTGGFKINQIPVPRNLTAIPIPKLPPDLSLDFPVSEGSWNKNLPSKESDHTVAVLQENLVNIQQLIEEQNKLNKKLGQPVVKLDAEGIPETSDKQTVVYYVSPVEKQSTTAKNVRNAGFTHDSSAGRFKCTLCGYTCEYQRTIKAHVWKHSGNKNIEYPMFQNGPLSIYDDGNYTNTEVEETNEILEGDIIKEEVISSDGENSAGISKASVDAKTNQTGTSKLPSFIVYDQTRISNVAPALANLLAARTMANMSKTKKADNDESDEPETQKLEGQEIVKKNADENGKCTVKTTQVQEYNVKGLNTEQPLKITESVNIIVDTDQLNAIHGINNHKVDNVSTDRNKSPGQTKAKSNVVVESVNVVVEAVNSVNTSCGYTGLQSQQNSPRITLAPRSPDSGVSEITSTSRTADDKSSSELTSPVPSLEHIGGTEDAQSRPGKRKLDESSAELKSSEEYSETKKSKSQSLEDSAVTLLSLLKKGPNYNPACPPKAGNMSSGGDTASVPSPGQEDSNSTGDTDSKPKSGISTSLLAVIEQLRERSKSDFDDEKPMPIVSSKKTSKRRSRRSSIEGNESAEGIENVEQFEVDGLLKFRCKLCHYTNDSTLLLKQHMRLHKPKQEFECSLCDLIAESSEALQDHMIQHCKVRTYQCKLCNSAFNYKSQLRAHMRMHNEPYLLLCEYCDFETRSAAALKTHIKSHLTKPPYKCDICKEEFITSFNLRIHKREGCYTSIDRLGHFKCDKCEYTSIGRREMKNHQRVHLVRNVIQQQKDCPYCDFTGANVIQIQQHIADIHGESKPLKCEMCGFVAVSIRSLKSHMKRHVNDQRYVAQPLEQYKCNLCGYVCHHLPSLKSHMWRHAADQHYSYEFTNDIINAAIDFDSLIDAADTTEIHVNNFKKLIFEKMKSKGLEGTRNTQEESAAACCWVTFRCCQCGFETINKAELNMHMTTHSDVIKWTLDVSEEDNKQEDVPMVIQEQVVPFVETNNAFPQIMNA